MSLVIASNVNSLIAQGSLNKTSSNLGTALQRLSTGLKLNSGADGPAALIISNEQLAQISGINAAIQNSSNAINVVQIASGALNEVSSLLNQIRGLAIDAANTGVNDAQAVAADQLQVQNALNTVDRIANTTQYGSSLKLLNGSAGITGTVINGMGNISIVNTNSAASGTQAVSVSRAAQRAAVSTGIIQTQNLAQNETLNVNGVSIGLTAGQTATQVQNTINQYTSQTGVVAENANGLVGVVGGTAITLTGGSTPATASTALTATTQGQNLTAGDTVTITGTTANNATVNATFTYGSGAGQDGTKVSDFLTKISNAFNQAYGGSNTGPYTASLDSAGNVVLSYAGTVTSSTVATALTLADGGSGHFTSVPTFSGSGFGTLLRTNAYGSGATISVSSNVAAGTNTSGFTGATAAGVDVQGTIGNSGTITGSGNVLTYPGTAGNPGVSVAVTGISSTSDLATVTGNLGSVNIQNNSLTFQIGANANQTAEIAINNIQTSVLGTGVAGNQFSNLSQINVQSQSGAESAIAVIDSAISTISTLAGNLGSFQTNTLTATQNNLQTSLQNETGADSTIRDTDFAQAMASYSQTQVQVQADTSVLSFANQTNQLVLSLLQNH